MTNTLERMEMAPDAPESLRQDFERHLRRTLAKDRYTATDCDRYFALALAVRDRLIERWNRYPADSSQKERQANLLLVA